jgi:Family of unknown function (DUF6221)
MDDLIAFVTARLDEEHFFAYKFVYTDGGEWTSDELARLWWYGDPPKSRSATDPIIQHAAHCNPARALREVEAKRRILAEVKDQIDGMDAKIEEEWGDGPWPTGASDLLVKLLALPYSGHPDYRQEWAPTGS